MKKIISGFFFRAMKAIELWIFVILLIFMTFMNTDADSMNRKAVLKADYELPFSIEETYKIYGGNHTHELDKNIFEKIDALLENITYSSFISLIATPLFTLYFMGKMFSGGALRNLITCGHSKTEVYLASLLFGAIITISFDVLGILSTSAGILIRGYKIPLLIPFLMTFLLYSLLLHLTFLTLSVSILFISGRSMVSLIAVSGIVIVLFTGLQGSPWRHFLSRNAAWNFRR